MVADRISAGTKSARSPRFALLHWDADGVPYSVHFQDRYFSRTGAMAESRHVFVQGNRLAQRWSRAATRQDFCIAEIGFGYALNFLNVWRQWSQQASGEDTLYYIGIESHPPQEENLRRVLHAHAGCAGMTEELLRLWCCPAPGWHNMQLAMPGTENAASVRLQLLITDAEEGLGMLREVSPPPKVDAWFLDGFSPAKNPSAWTDSLFAKMRELSAPGCSCATYSAAGSVRRSLEQNGFRMRRSPGHGRKKHMLRGIQTTAAPATHPAGRSRQDCRQTLITGGGLSRQDCRQTLIIGGGLSGAATAAALARRGIRVVVLEKNPSPAQGASAQPVGILYPRLSPAADPAAYFSLTAYQHAIRCYRDLFARGTLIMGRDGDFCGMLELACDRRIQNRQRKLAQIYHACPELLYPVDMAQAEQLSGITQHCGGIFYPMSGWLRPDTLCMALLHSSPNISIQNHAFVNHLQYEKTEQKTVWTALDENGKVLARANRAVLASGHEAGSLCPGIALGLQALRGQSTILRATEQSMGLRTVLCHKGYISPAMHQENGSHHIIGATHEAQNQSEKAQAASDLHNLSLVRHHVPALLPPAYPPAHCSGAVGMRCVRPSRMPLVGALPEKPGLYMNLAHGGRGLCLIPLCAEIIAAAICNETPPVEQELLDWAAQI